MTKFNKMSPNVTVLAIASLSVVSVLVLITRGSNGTSWFNTSKSPWSWTPNIFPSPVYPRFSLLNSSKVLSSHYLILRLDVQFDQI